MELEIETVLLPATVSLSNELLTVITEKVFLVVVVVVLFIYLFVYLFIYLFTLRIGP